MTIDKQKILKYIPIVQLATLFFWDRYARKNNVKLKERLKTDIKMVIFLLIITIPRMILHFVLKNELLDNIIFYISIYPTFLGLATLAVAAQEKHALDTE